MTKLEALTELAAKVEEGEEWPALYDGKGLYSLISSALGVWSWEVIECVTKSYKGSLDAALALHEAVLPGCQFHIATEANGEGFVAEIFDCKLDRFIAHACTDRTARAWLLAIIKALIA